MKLSLNLEIKMFMQLTKTTKIIYLVTIVERKYLEKRWTNACKNISIILITQSNSTY